jgi:hypothetical protein
VKYALYEHPTPNSRMFQGVGLHKPYSKWTRACSVHFDQDWKTSGIVKAGKHSMLIKMLEGVLCHLAHFTFLPSIKKLYNSSVWE